MVAILEWPGCSRAISGSRRRACGRAVARASDREGEGRRRKTSAPRPNVATMTARVWTVGFRDLRPPGPTLTGAGTPTPGLGGPSACVIPPSSVAYWLVFSLPLASEAPAIPVAARRASTAAAGPAASRHSGGGGTSGGAGTTGAGGTGGTSAAGTTGAGGTAGSAGGTAGTAPGGTGGSTAGRGGAAGTSAAGAGGRGGAAGTSAAGAAAGWRSGRVGGRRGRTRRRGGHRHGGHRRGRHDGRRRLCEPTASERADRVGVGVGRNHVAAARRRRRS